MAEVTRQEFADMCGIDNDQLRSYISRKKIIVCGKDGKHIDTTNPVNKAFKEKRKASQNAKKEMGDVISRIPPAMPRLPQRVPSGDDEDDLPPPLDENMINAYLLEKRGKRDHGDGDSVAKWLKMKMKGDAELVALRVEKEQLLLDKAAGKLVPVDVAADVLRSQAKTIFVNFENAIENIATVFCNIMAGGDITQYTRIVEACRKELHTAITRAGADATVELGSILNNYADSRANKLL
jgi:hypothetical protein